MYVEVGGQTNGPMKLAVSTKQLLSLATGLAIYFKVGYILTVRDRWFWPHELPRILPGPHNSSYSFSLLKRKMVPNQSIFERQSNNEFAYYH